MLLPIHTTITSELCGATNNGPSQLGFPIPIIVSDDMAVGSSSNTRTWTSPFLPNSEQLTRARFNSPHLSSSRKLSPIPDSYAKFDAQVGVEQGNLEDERRYSENGPRWSLPAAAISKRKSRDPKRRARIGLALGAGLGMMILVYVLSANAGSEGWERWGLVKDVDGLTGGEYLDIGDWRGIDPSRARKPKPVEAGHGPKGKSKGKGKQVEKDDGLYRVDPTAIVADGGPHPVSILIERANQEWADKVARQSQTLKEAVIEYRRRYEEAPPAGFEKWWAYIQLNDVPLPDEYDQISRDIHLFHPHAPSTIISKHKQAAKLSDTFIIKNTKGIPSVQRNFDPAKHRGGEQRITAQMALLEDVAEYIGDFEAVWSVHDNGRLFTSWSQRRDLLEALSERSYVEEEETEEQNGWSAVCPMTTRFTASTPQSDRGATPPTAKSFISSLPKSLSLCDHPSLLPLHGATSGPYRIPRTTGHLPLFSYSRTSLHSDILGIPYSHLVSVTPTAWEDKTKEKLLWRGGLTGAHYDDRVKWRDTQRFRLLDIAKRRGNTSILTPKSSSVKLVSTGYAEAAAHYLDVGATGKAIQCDKPTCDLIEASYTFAPRMSHAQAAAYKYVLDVDGNAWSARFKGLLSTGTVVLKSTIMPEWWTERAQAWVHYVPVGVAYDDLLDVMAYFTGDLSGQGGNDAAGQRIAEAGQDWASTHWRQEDMVAYSFRLYLEWARVWGGGDRKVGYVYDEADEV